MSAFMGRPISKETIALSLGGQIERGEETFPPRSQIKFEAVAVMSSVKHKFLADGGVEESYILVIDPATFRVREISGPVTDPELPL